MIWNLTWRRHVDIRSMDCANNCRMVSSYGPPLAEEAAGDRPHDLPSRAHAFRIAHHHFPSATQWPRKSQIVFVLSPTVTRESLAITFTAFETK